ncbi:MAG: hypothetical protein OFPI_28010 [Osedax symbiont Rs2]|nr:MAG: hypothetical protein OFPI_28010 [Osedax symbiont Rs2]
MKNLPLKALQTFEAVARHKSYQGAAQELYVTPSAVSHQIKNLQQWLDCPLFERKGNQLKIFPAAQKLALSLSLSLGDIALACRLMREQQQSTKLVIAAIPAVATCWLIPRLTDFQRLHPEISLRVSYAIHGTEIDFNEVDIAFIYAPKPPQPRDSHVELFRSAESFPVCSADFLRNHGPFNSAKQIASASFLQDAVAAEGWKEWLHKANCALAPQVAGPSFDDFNLLRSAALAGQGIALCPLAMIEDDLSSRRLVQLSDISVCASSGYYMLQKSAVQPGAATAAKLFRDWVFSNNN